MSDFKSSAPSKSGYTCVGAVNSSGFDKWFLPYGSYQIQQQEKAHDYKFYGDAAMEFGINPSGKINAVNIMVLNDPSGYTHLRSDFLCSFSWDSHTSTLVKTNQGEGADTSEYTTPAERTVLAAKSGNNLDYILIVKTPVSIEFLRKICEHLNYRAVINLDGGRSSGYILGNESFSPRRN